MRNSVQNSAIYTNNLKVGELYMFTIGARDYNHYLNHFQSHYNRESVGQFVNPLEESFICKGVYHGDVKFWVSTYVKKSNCIFKDLF